MMQRRFRWAVLLAAAAVALAACTENPFDDGEAISAKRNLRGTVAILDTGEPAAGIYVWLEGVDVGTFTNGEGRFDLELPRAAQQANGGFTGAANLYFFMANLVIDSTRIILRNGEFLYAQGPVDAGGALREPVQLKKLVDVTTEIVPAVLFPDFDDTLTMHVRLDVRVDAVDILTKRSETLVDTQMFAQAFLDAGLLTGPEVRVLSIPTAQPVTRRLNRGVFRDSSAFIISADSIGEGEFIVTPFLWVRQPGVPDPLLRSLGTRWGADDPSYLNLPFLRTPDTLLIGAPQDTTGGGGDETAALGRPGATRPDL